MSFLTADMEDARDNVFFQTIKFLGVLQEFVDPQVRSALQTGSVCRCDDAGAMLASIDEIRRIMMPALSGDDIIPRQDRAIAGVRFFVSLLAKTQEEPLTVAGLPFPKRQTFEKWFVFFAEFSSSAFWQTFRPKDVPSKHDPRVQRTVVGDLADLQSDFDRLDVGRNTNAHILRPSTRGAVNHYSCRRAEAEANCGSVWEDPVAPRFKFSKPRQVDWDSRASVRAKSTTESHSGVVPRRSMRQMDYGNDPERVRTRHSTEGRPRRSSRPAESTSFSSSCESGTDGSSSSDRRSRHRGRHRRYPRDVVPPGSFDGHGSISLRSYLIEYEHYFWAKYDGTTRQKAKHLGDFLSGPAREAYEALDGSHLEYSSVKKKLLKWYASKRISTRETAEAEFDRACMRDGESFSIFALRLERLAARAFPASAKERNRHLARKFWSSTPKDFVRVLMDSRRNYALSTGNKTLTWAVIKRLAETEDRYSRMDSELPIGESDRAAGIWYSRPESRNGEQTVARKVRYVDEVDDHILPVTGYALNHSGGVPERASSGLEKPICNWCGRKGHNVENCWERAGFCTLCGSDDHEKQNCRKFDETRLSFKPTCPKCEGSHLGKYCAKSQLN